MIAVFVSALMWLLVASLLVLRRGRGERNITYASVTIAIAMTLNVDPAYRALDRIAGGTNLVTLVADAALMVGVFFLGRGVMKASEHQPWAVRLALGRFALVAALVGVAVAFVFIDSVGTTTTFMLEFGAQPAAAAYSMIQFAYYGIVLSAMAALAARQVRGRAGNPRLPPAALLIGSICGILLSVLVITMDVAHLVGNLEFMAVAGVAYTPLQLSAFILLCLGFAGQPAASTLQARSRDRTTRMLVDELHPMWAEATRVRPGISQNESVALRADGSDILLHRQIVEIRDAMIDTRVSFNPSNQDKEILERAERHLLGFGSSDSASTVQPATSARGRQHR